MNETPEIFVALESLRVQSRELRLKAAEQAARSYHAGEDPAAIFARRNHAETFTPSGNPFVSAARALHAARRGARRQRVRERLFVALAFIACCGMPITGFASLAGPVIFGIAFWGVCVAGLLALCLIPFVFGRAGK